MFALISHKTRPYDPMSAFVLGFYLFICFFPVVRPSDFFTPIKYSVEYLLPPCSIPFFSRRTVIVFVFTSPALPFLLFLQAISLSKSKVQFGRIKDSTCAENCETAVSTRFFKINLYTQWSLINLVHYISLIFRQTWVVFRILFSEYLLNTSINKIK